MPLTPSDGTFDTTVTTTLDDSWAADKLTVIGLLTKAVSQVISDNLLDMEFINANSMKINEMTSTQGIISMPQTEHSTQHAVHDATTFFTLDGKQVDGRQLRPGLYIQRDANGATRKVSIK